MLYCVKVVQFCALYYLINFLCVPSYNKKQDADDGVENEEHKAVDEETVGLGHVGDAAMKKKACC